MGGSGLRKRLRKAARKLREGKPSRALAAIVTPHHSETRIADARAEVAAYLAELHGNQVAHGPFKGMRLPEVSSWGRSDVSAKILGTYERQVAEALTAQARTDGLLVDLGPADGYFAVGALRAGLFGTCLAFEKSERGRAVLSASAEANGVADRLTIRGEATEHELLSAIPEGQTGTLLCDIEGGEFRILTDTVLSHLSAMHLIVEMHDFLLDDGAAQRDALLARAAQRFDVEILLSADPQVSTFRELDHFDDDHRLLAFSEGRDRATEWLMLHPKGAD